MKTEHAKRVKIEETVATYLEMFVRTQRKAMRKSSKKKEKEQVLERNDAKLEDMAMSEATLVPVPAVTECKEESDASSITPSQFMKQSGGESDGLIDSNVVASEGMQSMHFDRNGFNGDFNDIEAEAERNK